MKNIYLTAVAFFVTTFLFGQSSFKKNDLYFEAGGNGLFGSVNYERQVSKLPGLGLRFGLGFYTEKAFYLTIPIGVNYLFPLNNHSSFIDAGVGATWARQDAKVFNDKKNFRSDNFVNFIPSIGYRKHTANDLMWRISLTPVANKDGFTPWIGLSLGKRF